MNIISYDGFVFASNDFWTGIDYNAGRAQWSLIPNVQSRLNAPGLLTGSMITERPIPVNIGYSGASTYEAAFNTLMGALDPMNPEPRTLVAQLNDGTNVSCEAVVILPGHATDENDVDVLLVTFLTTSPYWTEVTPSTDGPDTINAADPDTVIVNGGAVAVAPVITRSAPTVAFSSSQMTKYPITITNDSDLPLERETILARIFSAHDDVRDVNNMVLKDGSYLGATTLINSATEQGLYVQFPASVDAGESETYDVLSGSPGFSLPVVTYTPAVTKFNGDYCALDIGYESRTATSGTASTIVDTAATWVTNRWAGACLFIIDNTGEGQARRIASNTATTLTVTRNFTTNPAAGSIFFVLGSGWYLDGGQASAASATTITDSSQTWQADSLIGGTVYTIGGTGSGQSKTITANTATQITFGTMSPAPNTTTIYRIERPGYHRYYVDQVKHSEQHRGGWQQNARFTRPGKIAWGPDVLNGWEPYLHFENGDDFNQSRTCPVDVGGGDIDYFPILDADRRRGQDRRLEEEGQADGVSIYHPLGYRGMRFDYKLKNPNSASGATTGICKFVLGVREAGGDELTYVVSDTQLQASLTNVAAQYVNLGNNGLPQQLYMGLIPADEVEVSRDAADNDTATVRWHTVLELWVNVAQFTQTTGTGVAVIPIEDEIRIGDYALQIGMREGQRLWTKAAGQTIKFDCENARAWIEESSVEVADVTYAVTPVKYDGTSYVVADRWPVLEPGNNTVTCDGDPWASTGAFTLTFTFSEKIYG